MVFGMKQSVLLEEAPTISMPSPICWQRPIGHVKKSGARNVGVLGSSYSAGLVLVLSAQDPAFADAVMSFSPGEYFGSSDYVAKELGNISVPVLLTSARAEVGQWQAFEKSIKSPVDGFVPTGAGRHGASALTSADGAEYWSALEGFLDRNLPAN